LTLGDAGRSNAALGPRAANFNERLSTIKGLCFSVESHCEGASVDSRMSSAGKRVPAAYICAAICSVGRANKWLLALVRFTFLISHCAMSQQLSVKFSDAFSLFDGNGDFVAWIERF